MENTLNKEFEKLMYELDFILTGKRPQGYQPERSIEKFFDEVWYLSDGGYSRIAYNWDTGKIFLTSNSLDKPKDAWNTLQAQEKIATINTVLQQFMQSVCL